MSTLKPLNKFLGQLQLVPASMVNVDPSDPSNKAPSSGGGLSLPLSNRRVRTLYACVGENETELTFEPNQIIINGKFRRDQTIEVMFLSYYDDDCFV